MCGCRVISPIVLRSDPVAILSGGVIFQIAPTGSPSHFGDLLSRADLVTESARSVSLVRQPFLSAARIFDIRSGLTGLP